MVFDARHLCINFGHGRLSLLLADGLVIEFCRKCDPSAFLQSYQVGIGRIRDSQSINRLIDAGGTRDKRADRRGKLSSTGPASRR